MLGWGWQGTWKMLGASCSSPSLFSNVPPCVSADKILSVPVVCGCLGGPEYHKYHLSFGSSSGGL